MIKHWEYRAIDSQMQIIDGSAQAPSFLQLSVALRQRGLQVIEATEIHLDKVLANKRLLTMKQRIQPTPKRASCSNTSNWLLSFIRLVVGS